MTDVSIIDFEEFENFTEKYWNNKLYETKNMDNLYNSFREKHILPFKIDPRMEIEIYKKLLKKIKTQNKDKYNRIHKGTPFYWIGWNSFLMKHYEQAIFYLDAAVAEDKKNHVKWIKHPRTRKPTPLWLQSGAAMFFRMEDEERIRMIYDRIHSNSPNLSDLVKIELNRFNSLNNNGEITFENFIDLFVEVVIKENNTAIITALYSFIFQRDDILEMIRFRSKYGGTIEPIIINLFKGALIFETLIKKCYNGNRCINQSNTLGCILRENSTQGHYGYIFQQCSAIQLEDIFDYIDRNSYGIDTAFHVTCKIRNTTAHNLLWNDIFNEGNFNKLYQNIINAIFYVIQRDYII